MRRLIENRWFPIAEFVLVLACGTILYLHPSWGVWMILIAFLPWVGRIAAGRFPYQRTVFDIPIFIFLLTALVGVWAAYNSAAATAKFWLIVVSTLLYYAAARQSDNDLWIICGILAGLAALLSLFIFLTFDWQSLSVSTKLLSFLGQSGNDIVPPGILATINANMTGGILAIIFPFNLAFGIEARRRQRAGFFYLSVAFGLIIAMGLILTSSRGAWAALAAGLGLWLLWKISRWLGKPGTIRHKLIFASVLATGLVIVSLALAIYPNKIISLANLIPGADTAQSRVDIARNTLYLIEDFPFTGGGLASFAGLYSRYILLIPNFIFGYSHNLYLDIFLEQGLIGFTVFFVVIIGSLVLLVTRQMDQVMRWAILAAMVTLLLHGMIDDAIYGVEGTALLFIIPGLIIAASRLPSVDAVSSQPEMPGFWGQTLIVLAPIAAILILFLASGFGRDAFYANLGAVYMARSELAEFPQDEWVTKDHLPVLAQAEAFFNRSLKLNPFQRTSNQRMGLLAVDRQDFPNAVTYLERAHQAAPAHPNINKALGYAYAWNGSKTQAAQLLRNIPGSINELETYSWWWIQQGRNDLSLIAATLADALR